MAGLVVGSRGDAAGMTNAKQKQALGAYGEALAARHLTQAGLEVIDRNWRCDQGELDIVLWDGPVLVACEVKTRRSDAYGTPHEAFTPIKAARVRRLAFRWLREHDVHAPHVRVDLVAVIRPVKGTSVIDHVVGIA